MAYKTKFSGNADKAIKLGGTNNETGRANPTSLEGYFLGSKNTKSAHGPGKLHIFQTPEGTVGVWGTSKLNDLMTSDIVGQMCEVTFTGMIPPRVKGRKPAYGYKVRHDEDNTTDVSGIDLNAAEPAEAEESDEQYVSNSSSGPGDEEEDEAPIAASVRPAVSQRAALAPAADRQAAVQALLASRRK